MNNNRVNSANEGIIPCENESIRRRFYESRRNYSSASPKEKSLTSLERLI